MKSIKVAGINVSLIRLCLCFLAGFILIACHEADAANTTPVNTVAVSRKTHWLTASSKKRHNSGCRYFKKSKGRMCTPNEGTPCKICGG